MGNPAGGEMKIRSPERRANSDAEWVWDGAGWVSSKARPDLQPP